MKRRPGFTLIEMLVSMALTIFLMVILAQAFVAGLETFRQLKAVGDMEASLRTASNILRRDLAADHFDGKRRLSDAAFWNPAVGGGPPREGFFCIFQGSSVFIPPQPPTGYTDEGADADGLHAYRATDHILHFAVKLRGNQQPNFFSAKITALNSPLFNLGLPDSRFQGAAASRTYNSAWAEVAYFLAPNGQTANGTTLYALYRRQLLAVPNNDALNWDLRLCVPASPTALADYKQVSYWVNRATPTPYLYFNSPADLTVPTRRFAQFNPSNYKPMGTGDDLLLTNVVSFEVKVLLGPTTSGAGPGNGFINLYDLDALKITSNNPLFTKAPRVFDTWSSIQDDTDGTNFTTWATPGTLKSAPLTITLGAVSVTLRVWDAKTEQTRQITVIQDM